MSDVLDAGALIAADRGDRAMWTRIKSALDRPPLTHGGVIGQVWRGGARQARLARLLPGLDIQALDEDLGRASGSLLGASASADVIDAALVLLSVDGDIIYTSDPEDIAHLAAARGLHVHIVPV